MAPSARTYAAGGGLTVVNAFTNANGSLQARFHRLLGSGFRERLATRIRTSWGTERVLEIQASTEWQHRSGRLLRAPAAAGAAR